MRSSWKRNITLYSAQYPFRRFSLVVSYDGSEFFGWQRQSSDFSLFDNTVQGAIEAAIYKITGSWATCYGSGRTDSGVHALGQVAHFDSDKISMDGGKLRLALNANLPKSIRILECKERFDAFHARFSTFLREYIYMIKSDDMFTALDYNRVWNVRKKPDITLLSLMSEMIKGEDKDFKNFDFTNKSIPHTSIRDVLVSEFFEKNGCIYYRIAGNAFLYHQVRAIVGTIIEFERRFNEKSVEEFKSFLNSYEKTHFIAPSFAFYLVNWLHIDFSRLSDEIS